MAEPRLGTGILLSTEPVRDKISYNIVPYGTGTSVTASFLQK